MILEALKIEAYFNLPKRLPEVEPSLDGPIVQMGKTEA